MSPMSWLVVQVHYPTYCSPEDPFLRHFARLRPCNLSATLVLALKPLYKSNNAQAFWDVPLFAEHQEVRTNRMDERIIDHLSKQIITLEMRCPWVTNREKKKEKKTIKYGLLRWESKQKYQGYEVKQYNSELTQQDGWKTQDGRMTKKCRVRLGMHSLARHFFAILPS